MFNIFLAVFFVTLSFAFVEPFFFIGYLISIAAFGLYQAMFMANAGGAWDNAKKIVEVELKQKGTPLHDATVVGDTVGDPFKDTAGPALNPMIKVMNLVSLLILPAVITLRNNNGARYAIAAAALAVLLAALAYSKRAPQAMDAEATTDSTPAPAVVASAD
jgi:K(+)-stimulated pyrophosphate-energized sodium pump